MCAFFPIVLVQSKPLTSLVLSSKGESWPLKHRGRNVDVATSRSF